MNLRRTVAEREAQTCVDGTDGAFESRGRIAQCHEHLQADELIRHCGW